MFHEILFFLQFAYLFQVLIRENLKILKKGSPHE